MPKAERALGFDDLRADRGEFDLIDEIAGFGTFQYQQLYRALIDDGGALAMETAVVGLTVTYAGATAAFLTPETLAGTSAWVVGLLPAPLWLVAVFLSVFSAAQGRRTLRGTVHRAATAGDRRA